MTATETAPAGCERVLLRPREMGGTDAPSNAVWLPSAAARQKADFDRRVQMEWPRGTAVEYAAVPTYAGADRCPARLALTALGLGRSLRRTIDVANHRAGPAARRPWWKFW